MTMQDNEGPRSGATAARVDYLVDENGSRVNLPDDAGVRPTGDTEAAVGATGPSSWWRLGIIAVALLALALLIIQMLNGGAGTAVAPDSPTVMPQAIEPPQSAPAADAP